MHGDAVFVHDRQPLVVEIGQPVVDRAAGHRAPARQSQIEAVPIAFRQLEQRRHMFRNRKRFFGRNASSVVRHAGYSLVCSLQGV